MPTINEIVVFLQAEDSFRQFVLAGDTFIRRPAPIAEAGEGEVAFCGMTARNSRALLASSHASLLIIDRSIPFDEQQLVASGVRAVILRDNARLAFLRVVKHFFADPRPQGIHPTAVIHPEAKIPPGVCIGPFTYVGNCEIGVGTIIDGHVHIYDGKIRIGQNVMIHAGTIIGVDGFGYSRDESEELEFFPSIGGVIIEDDVEIHSNVNIDRGTLANTIIGQGTKIDKFCHIGHNVRIGKHCVITAHSMLGGGARIGDYVWIAPCVCIRDGGIRIGDRAFVGMAAVVTKDVPDRTTVVGSPARELTEFRKLLSVMNGLLKTEVDH